MNIATAADLDNAIKELEVKSELQKGLLRNHFNDMIESLKPANLLRSAVDNIADRSSIINDAVGTTVAMGAGALSKKIVMGRSSNIFKRMLGGLVEFTVSKGIANNFDAIAVTSLKFLKKIAK